MALEPSELFGIHEEELPSLFASCFEKILCENLDAKINERFPACPSEKFEKLEGDIILIIKKCALGMISAKEFDHCFIWMKDGTKKAIIECLEKNKQAVRRYLLSEEMKHVHHLTDFDYNIKLSVSSCKIMDLNQPLLSLFLQTKTSAGQNRVLHMEMTTAEVQDLILLLTEVKRKIEMLSAKDDRSST